MKKFFVSIAIVFGCAYLIAPFGGFVALGLCFLGGVVVGRGK
jgi:hypothetical protein